jgi:hypothetical protein
MTFYFQPGKRYLIISASRRVQCDLPTLMKAVRCTKKRWFSEKKTRPPPGAMIEFIKDKTAGACFLQFVQLNSRINTDPLSILTEFFEGDNTINLGEQCVVSTTPNIGTRMNSGTELPDDDVTGPDRLTAEFLHPAALPAAVAAVSRTAACFFMSHKSLPMVIETR